MMWINNRSKWRNKLFKKVRLTFKDKKGRLFHWGQRLYEEDEYCINLKKTLYVFFYEVIIETNVMYYLNWWK